MHYLRFPRSIDHAISMFSVLAGDLPEFTNVVSRGDEMGSTLLESLQMSCILTQGNKQKEKLGDT